MSANYAELLRLARKGRRAERTAEAGKNFVVATLGLAGAALVDGWLLMLAVGVTHAEWLHRLPTVGYWWATLLVYLLRGTFSHRKTET